MDPDLIKTYEETEYRVEDDPPLVLKIGERNDALRILFVSFSVESAVFITAWNPDGCHLTLDQNVERQADLLSEIERQHFNYFVGVGEHPVTGWREDSYLVLGIRREQATGIATQFDQNGYVWIGVDGVPELVMVSF